MSKDYGRPPLTEESRRLVEERLREVMSAGGVRETLTIEWRGQPLHTEVIDMPIEATYYNPGTHRIRVQRCHDPGRDGALQENAWSEESQEYLHYLLQALPSDPSQRDPKFDELKDSLRDFKQNDPGLISRDGILVNGNTRRAALKELGSPHIRVGVLPESCTWADINMVELSLQLRKDHRRDYSYVNRILAIDEQVSLGRPIEDVAREFRTKRSTCEQDLWILSALRDLIERSRDGDIQLRLLDFEGDQEKLRELHRRYIKDSEVDRDSADLMKESRLAAIVLGFSKTDVRLIEPDFKARYLDRRLPDWIRTERDAASGSVAIPGLNRSVTSASPKVAAASALTDVILKFKAVDAIGERVPAGKATEAAQTLKQVKDSFEQALEPAGKDARIRKRKQAAPDRVLAACENIEQCITDVVMARASRSLDEEAFDEALLKLRSGLGKLATESARSISAPGDGVSWLLDAGTRGDQ
jgi:hypothetical protein